MTVFCPNLLITCSKKILISRYTFRVHREGKRSIGNFFSKELFSVFLSFPNSRFNLTPSLSLFLSRYLHRFPSFIFLNVSPSQFQFVEKWVELSNRNYPPPSPSPYSIPSPTSTPLPTSSTPPSTSSTPPSTSSTPLPPRTLSLYLLDPSLYLLDPSPYLLDPSLYLLDPSLYLLDPSSFLPSEFLCLLFLCSAPDVYLSTSLTYSLNALLFNKIFGDDGDWVLHLGEILGMFGVGAGNKSLLPRGVWGRAISLLRVKGIGIRWGW